MFGRSPNRSLSSIGDDDWRPSSIPEFVLQAVSRALAISMMAFDLSLIFLTLTCCIHSD